MPRKSRIDAPGSLQDIETFEFLTFPKCTHNKNSMLQALKVQNWQSNCIEIQVITAVIKVLLTFLEILGIRNIIPVDHFFILRDVG